MLRIGFTTIVVIGHAFVVVTSFLLASVIRYDEDTPARWSEFFANPWLALAGYVLLALLIFQWSGLYRFDDRWSMASELRNSFKAVGLLALVTLVLLYLFNLDEVSRIFLVVYFALMWAGVSLTTIAVRKAYAIRRAGGKGLRHVLIVGTDPMVVPFIENLVENHRDLGIEVTGYLGYDRGLGSTYDYLGQPHDLPAVLQQRVIDEVIVTLEPGELGELDAIVHAAQEQGKTVRIPLQSMGYSISEGEVESVDGTSMLTVTSGPRRTLAFATKRLIDVAVSALALIVLSPVFLLIAVAILIFDERPILYVDRRAGIHGRPIKTHKFRTMVPDANDQRAELAEMNDRDGPAFKIEDDPRITDVGRFLRATSLDETPQLWDVLMGRMSLVGPRPQPLDEVEGFEAWHRRRLSVKPGMTGLWQVTARDDPSFETRAQLDLEYIDNWSTALDIKILLKTIPVVIKATGT